MNTGSDERSPVDLMVEDYLDRRQRGETPSIEEYCRRHPELEDEIREVFEALLMVEDLKPGSKDNSGTFGSDVQLDGRRLERVGDYRIQREIGRGGMGVVYEAEQESLGRRVALKVLPRQLSDDPNALERFQREARAAARMHHTNIVPVFDVGKDDQHLFYAMQLIQGQGLDQVIDELERLRSEYKTSARSDGEDEASGGRRHGVKEIAASLMSGHFHPENYAARGDSQGSDPENGKEGPDAAVGEKSVAATISLAMQSGASGSATLPGQSDISTAESNYRAYFLSVAQIGLQTASALSYSHARGIIHRDIKPSNLILDAAGIVWVTDFGLAKTGDQGMTHTGDILGTIRYMSPERFRGQCDVRADVYALGLTLYELLVLKPAFESSDRLKLIDLVSKSEPLAPRAVDPRIPRDLETIVLKAIDKEPRRRYQSADEMADDLQRVVNDEPILARRISIVERAARWSRRNPWLATASSAAVLGLVAVAVLSMLFAREQKRLNQELTQANDKQKRLYVELEQTNEKMAEMIDRLRGGQSRLAQKQAEYDLEQGNLGEGLLWLARSYELAPPDDSPLREELRTHLSVAAEQMPRLRMSVSLETRSPIGAVTAPPFARRANGPPGGTRTGIAGRGGERAGFGQSSSAIAAVSRDRRYLILADSMQRPAGEEQQPTRRVRLWDIAEQRFTGRAIEVPMRGQLDVAVSPDSRLVATIRSVRSGPPASTSSRIAETLQCELTVSSVATGETVFGPVPVRPVGSPSYRIAPPPISFSRDGSRVLVALGYPEATSSRRRYRYDVLSWAADTGSPQEGGTVEIEHQIPVGINARFSLDATCLLVSFGYLGIQPALRSGWVRIFDVETGEAIGNKVDFDGGVTECLPLSPNGHRFGVVISRRNGRDNRAEVWDLDKARQLGASMEFADGTHGRTIKLLGADESGSRLVIASVQTQSGIPDAETDDAARPSIRGQVRVWGVMSGKPLTPPIFTTGRVRAASFVAAGTSILVCDANSVRTWELPCPRLRRVLLPNEGPLRRLPRQLLGIIAYRSGGVSPQWDATGDLEYGEHGDLYMARIIEDLLYVTRWDTKSGRILNAITLADAGNAAVRFAPGARVLCTLAIDGTSQVGSTMRCWRTDNGEPVGSPIRHDRIVLPLAVSPGGEMIAAIELNVPDRETGESVLSEDGTLRSLGQTGRLRVWETATGEVTNIPESARFPLGAEVARFVDRTTLMFGTRELMRVWDLETGLVQPVPSRVSVEPFEGAALMESQWTLGRDGRLVADFSGGYTLRIWDRRTGHALVLPIEHQQPIAAVTFDLEGRTVATASMDGLVRQWSLPGVWSSEPTETMAHVEALVGMTLDDLGRFGILDPDSQSQRLRETGISESDESVGNQLSYSQWAALLDFESGNWDDATSKLDRWVADQPQQWLPQVLRIRALLEQQRFDEARQSVEQAVHLCDATTVAYWLQRFLHARGGDRINRLVPEPPGGGDVERERILQQWYLDRLLEISPASVWVPEWVVRRADIHETQGELSDAIAVLSQAINRHPNGEELLKKRARLYEKTLQWKLATEDRRAAAQADPMDHQGRYWVGTMLLYNDDVEVYRQLCHEMLERWGESDDPRIQERTAKLCLMLPVDGDDFERACSMIDAAYDAVATDWFRNHDVLVKALADCRRNRYDEAIKNVTEANAAFDERGRNMPIFSALGDLIAAMAWHKKGDPQLARRKYADALDRIDYVYELYIETGGLVPHDWMMAEIVRREAETLLGVSAETLDLPLPDTQDWKVVLSDDFDRDEVGDAWTVKNGQWALEDGALRGTVENQGASTMPSAGIRALDVKMPEYLEVEYDTWWPEGAISEVKLSDLDTRRDYIAGLCGSPHPILVGRGETGTGAQMLSSIAGRSGAGRWIAKDPEFELKPGQRYHIRLLRQPNRLTLFVDGKEIFSELVPTIDARTLRFYGSGPESAILYFDNLVVRAPEGETRP